MEKDLNQKIWAIIKENEENKKCALIVFWLNPALKLLLKRDKFTMQQDTIKVFHVTDF